MHKAALAVGIALVFVWGRDARAEADDWLARDLAKAMVDRLDVTEKANSQLRAFLVDEQKSCEVERRDAENDLDLRLRHMKALAAKIKELREKADAETLAEAEKRAKADGEAKAQKIAAKLPETQRILKRFKERCLLEADEVSKKAASLEKLAQ